MSIILRLAGSLAALVTALALLLADSAGPNCEVVPFDQTFRVTSSCPEFGEETIRVRLDAGPDDDLWPAELSHVDGDVTVVEVSLQGTCSDDGDQVSYNQLWLSLAERDAPAGQGTLDCFAPLDGSAGHCSSNDLHVDDSRTVTIEEVEGE